MREVNRKVMLAMIDLVYKSEAKVEKREREEFLNILKEHNILKVKSNTETKTILCNFYNRGICKAGQNCAFYHPEKDCESHMFGNVCGNRECDKRHRLICKY